MIELKQALIKLHQLLASQFGLDLRIFLRSLCDLSIYLRDRAAFRKGYAGNMKFMPYLHDCYEENVVKQ
jgi:hypothetical protein